MCGVCGEAAGKHSYYGGQVITIINSGPLQMNKHTDTSKFMQIIIISLYHQVCLSCRAFFRRSVYSGQKNCSEIALALFKLSIFK